MVNWAEDSLKRESGSKVHHANIQASKVCVIFFLRFTFIWSSCHFIPFPLILQAVADIIRTTLGPRSMLKMLLDAQGGVSIFSFSFEKKKKKLISSMIIWSYFCIACKSTIFCHCLIVSSSIQWFPILWKFEGHGFVNFVCCALSLFLNTISGFNRDRCHQWWKCHSPGIGYCTSSSKSMFSFNVLFLCFSLFFLLYSSLYATKLALLPVSSLLFYFVDALPIWHDMTFCC